MWLTPYKPTPSMDRMVVGWWERMAETGDLERTFTEGNRNLMSLFRMISPPNEMLYVADRNGIWFTMWAEPVMRGYFVGLWIAPERRHTRAALLALIQAWKIAFAVPWCEALIAVTKQPVIADELKRLGYAVYDPIPRFFDGENAYVTVLTREAFEATKARFDPETRAQLAAKAQRAAEVNGSVVEVR